MFRVTLFSGPSDTDPREAGVSVSTETPSSLEFRLAEIGREWKTADYMGQRQVVITIDPIADERNVAAIQAKVRDAVGALEATGLL